RRRCRRIPVHHGRLRAMGGGKRLDAAGGATTNRLADYDAIGDQYSAAKRAPWRVHLEAHTIERLAGDVGGARILDLACGDGFYTRRLKARGAADALGVDLSAEMISLARHAEESAPIGCRYEVADVSALGTLGAFDLVTVAYLFNYASTRAQLQRLCDVAYANLRPGGRLIGANDHTSDGAAGWRDFSSHGFRKHGPTKADEGQPITYEFHLDDGRRFAITNYYWRPDTYLQALRDSGFREAAWHAFALAPVTGFPAEFWADLVAVQPCAALSALR
ncbi:MAG: methyltransferase domain-containing protein, partial [Proteobacteria bacterium]|nr:methyltransferase domain-containing protein [Pseudomonadota bacterium]